MSTVPNTPDSDQNPLDAIRANLARDVTDWDPQPNDSVVGFIHQVEYIDTDKGTFPVMHVRNEAGGIVKVACGRSRLKKQLVRLKAQAGDAVGILYAGKVAAKKGGNDYHEYRVDVVRIGERNPADAFRDPEDDDLGLVAGAVDETAGDPWADGESDVQTEAGF